MANLCLGCMNPLPEGSDTCSICGFPREGQNPPQCLKTATVLQEHYTVGRVLREGSDSLLYLSYDRLLKEPCLIQEYYPSTLCQRQADGAVTPLGGCERPFTEYRESFQTVMRTLARAKELPTMIPVYDIFEENGTLYSVSDYCQGVTLTKHIKQAGGRLPWSEARPLFMSLLACISQLHSVQLRHLAICPDNILIGTDGRAHLRNYAIPEARVAGMDLKPELVDGFSAPEQYNMDGEAGDAADVYGLAATIFYTVTGTKPPAANSRTKNSDDLFMPAEVVEELSQQVCIALFNALQVDPAQRTATIAQLYEQLSVEPNVSALRNEAAEDDRPPVPEKKNNTTRTLLIVFGTALAAMLVVVIVLLSLLSAGRRQPEPETSGNATLPTISSTSKPTKTEKQYSVPKLLGGDYYELRDKTQPGDMTITVTAMQYSEKPAGTIISQDPEPGKSVAKGTNINIVLSCGKNDEITVPDVSGWQQEHARLYLEALGFRIEIAKLQASGYERGIVDSTDPAAGTVKRRGDTITLRVSNVEPTASAPDDTDTPDNNANGLDW